jgi:hypothetical protein
VFDASQRELHWAISCIELASQLHLAQCCGSLFAGLCGCSLSDVRCGNASRNAAPDLNDLPAAQYLAKTVPGARFLLALLRGSIVVVLVRAWLVVVAWTRALFLFVCRSTAQRSPD